MIARHRGAARAHSRWRPSAPASATSGPIPQPREAYEQQPQMPVDEARPVELGQWPRRRSRTLIAVATIGVIAVIAGRQHTGPTHPAVRLPSTPSGWIEQWTAAALDNPARVCNRLFAPALAAAFRSDTGRSCVSYYGSVNSSSFRIRRVIQDGGTATAEAQQVARGRTRGYFTVVLSHLHGGWQAVDIVPGGPVRPR